MRPVTSRVMEISYSAIFAFIFVIQFNDTFGQSGNVVREEACATQTTYVACPNPASVMRLESLTIYSTDQLGDILAWDPATSCYDIPKCQRNIAAGTTDTGLGEVYRYLYETVKGECEGRTSCFITGPNATTVYGEATEDYKQQRRNSSVKCPATPKQKIFVSMLLAARCVFGNFLTHSTPPATTPVTEATTPGTTESFPYVVHFYESILNDREKIILGVVIGLAIVILIVLLLILYCWDRLRNQTKFRKFLQKIGRPQANDDAYDETDFARKEHWMDETQDDGALGEYTGVKPDEFMTIDRKQLEESGQIISDSMFGTMTMGRSGANTASLARGGGYGYGGRPDLNPVQYSGPVDYDTEENLELEKRMAAAREGHAGGEDIEATTGM